MTTRGATAAGGTAETGAWGAMRAGRDGGVTVGGTARTAGRSTGACGTIGRDADEGGTALTAGAIWRDEDAGGIALTGGAT